MVREEEQSVLEVSIRTKSSSLSSFDYRYSEFDAISQGNKVLKLILPGSPQVNRQFPIRAPESESRADLHKRFDFSKHCDELKSDSASSRSVPDFDELVHRDHWMHIDELLRIDRTEENGGEVEFEYIPDEGSEPDDEVPVVSHNVFIPRKLTVSSPSTQLFL